MANFRRLLPPLLVAATLLLVARVALSQPPPADIVLLARAPSSWREVRAPWPFLWRVPWMESWQFAENKLTDPFVQAYKVDVQHPACATWQWVDDTPAVEFTFEWQECDGFLLVDGFYYFDLGGSAGATATPIPFPTFTPAPGVTPTVPVTATVTPTPGPAPALCPNARNVTVYGGGGGLQTPRCGCQQYGVGDGEWWALICEVSPERFQAFLDAWQGLVEDATSGY